MDGPFFRVLTFIFVAGLFGTTFGGYQCTMGYTYSVAARREATTVGRVVDILHGKGSIAYKYMFSVNGVKMDDYSEVCATPLVPGACRNNGPVLVYYSYQPFSNSRLEDFAIASSKAYRKGKLALAIALPLLFLSSAGLVILTRKDKSDDDSDAEDQNRTEQDSELPDDLHVAPGE